MAHRIELSPAAESHLQALTARQQSTVLDAIRRQLPHQPTRQTRNRKPMRSNPLAAWELRVETLRVYYGVDEEPEPVVFVRAIGVKVRNRVLIGGKEYDL